MYQWLVQDKVSKAVKECGVSKHVVVDWYNFCRDVCGQYFLDHRVTNGGPGRVVEIDESKFGRRKHNRGRVVDGHWIFGGVEGGTSRGFMVEVEDRSKHTQLPIIQQYILPGTTIISDEWRAYHDIGILPVNHSQNFVDRAHTQSIECYWSCTKRLRE